MGQSGLKPGKSRPRADYLAWAKHRMKRQNESEPGPDLALVYYRFVAILSLDKFFLGFYNEKSKLY